jgi:flagellar hook-basal body complex protein FliE
MTVAPIEAISSQVAADRMAPSATAVQTAPVNTNSFTQMLSSGLESVDQKVLNAQALAAAFTLDDNTVPLHRVTYALEEARLSVELMMQVRNRLLEGYQELMRMSL